uniref:hypothetical protein n=1 Tax=Paenibacillus sp. FSL H3-0469 TaxID=2954506 RepID=UPI0040476B63
MRVNVSKDILLKALQQVLRAVPANHVISILTGVHIQARMNELIVTASNSSMTIQYRIPQENTTLMWNMKLRWRGILLFLAEI